MIGGARFCRGGFISVGAVCQRTFSVCFGSVVSCVVGLICLVKRKQALRGRNLSRDSQAEGAPRVHRASGVDYTPGAFFAMPIGHPSHASENPAAEPRPALGVGVPFTSSRYRHCQVVALGGSGGIGFPVLRRRSGATRRVNSSLRSHRTQRSLCRRVCSGLNKTLFASIGPNLRWRGHRLCCPATPGRSSTVEQQRYQPGRIKPGRGHRLDGMSRVRLLAPTRNITKIPPHVKDLSTHVPHPFAEVDLDTVAALRHSWRLGGRSQQELAKEEPHAWTRAFVSTRRLSALCR